MTWSTATAWGIAGWLLMCVLICVGSALKSNRAAKRDWAKYTARAERNAFRDMKGLTK